MPQPHPADSLPTAPATPPPTRPVARPQCTSWATAVLLAGTLVLAGHLVLVLAAAGLAVSFAAAVGLVARVPPLDVPRLLLDVAPGVLAGWGVGLVSARALSAGSALGPRLVGVTTGLLGCAVGAVVLRATAAL